MSKVAIPVTDKLRAFNKWNGIWRWKADTAVFSNPVHSHLWESQTQKITVRDGELIIRCHQTFVGGGQRTWVLDSALDGIARPIIWEDDGSVMAVIGFFQVNETMGGDAYTTPDESFTGSEYFRVENDMCKVWGSTTTDGAQYVYYEEWDRVG